ncbi:MAG: O-antigen ligase family protein [Gammaproteobacteria bacterium]
MSEPPSANLNMFPSNPAALLGRLVFPGLVAVVFLSPLPYAANRPWSWSLWTLMVAVLGVCWCIDVSFNKNSAAFSPHLKHFRSAIAAFCAVLAWSLIQTSTAVPDGWTHPLWRMAERLVDGGVTASVSLNRADTATAAMRLSGYALTFWLALNYCHDRAKAGIVIRGLMIAGVLYSVYGLAMHLGGFKAILWREDWYYGAVTATFVNRNHFATFAGLALVCSLALLSDGVRHSTIYRIRGYLGLEKFLENLIVRNWFPLLAFIVIGTALVLTHSRGGFLSALMAIAVLLTALNLNRNTRNVHVAAVVGVFVLAGGAIFHISGKQLSERFGAWADDSAYRGEVYRLTWSAVKDNPLLGYGYGNFPEAFPLYKTPEIAGDIRNPLFWDYAHNTYLEAAFELGIPAAAALMFCFIRLGWICLRGLTARRRDLIYPAAGLSATFLIAGHSLVDFSMQIPAVAYIYSLLMGAACAQSFPTRRTA